MGAKQPWERSCSECESVESSYPCPLSSCSIHTSEKCVIDWVHSECDGKLRLYDNGKEKCQKCGSEFLFCCQDFNCGNKFSDFKIRRILQYLIGCNDEKVSDDFFFKLKDSFKHQKNEYPSKFN